MIIRGCLILILYEIEIYSAFIFGFNGINIPLYFQSKQVTKSLANHYRDTHHIPAN